MIANFKRTQKRAGANAIGRFFYLASCCALAAASAGAAHAGGPANPMPALRNGETLTYTVRWEFIPSVGRIKIAAETIGSGSNAVLRVTTTTWTWGIARGLFPFDGRGESVYQEKTGLLLSSSEWSSYRNKHVKNSITFNYGSMTAKFSDDIHPEKSHTVPMPQGDPSDLILALIQTRYWDLKPGQERDTLVIFEDQFFPLTIKAEQDTDFVFSPSFGFFKTVVLVPRMLKTPPIGMFKRGSIVHVWIATDDDRHLPVKFSVGFKLGTGIATLIDYQPPK